MCVAWDQHGVRNVMVSDCDDDGAGGSASEFSELSVSGISKPYI